jgi:hypothetical protein
MKRRFRRVIEPETRKDDVREGYAPVTDVSKAV